MGRRRTSRRVSRKRRTARKRVSRKRVVARRRRKKTRVGSKRQVFSGSRDKSSGGLKKSDLKMNKRGKVVSAKASSASKKRYRNSGASKWANAFKQARKNLGIKGFQPLKKGSRLYRETRRIYDGKKKK